MCRHLDDRPWDDVEHLVEMNIGEMEKRVAEGLKEWKNGKMSIN